jgi:hypothetical protein
MTRPRMRLEQGTDPSAAIERLYGASQLDRGDGLVHVNRKGEIVGRPTGFTGTGPAYQKPQFAEDQHGPGYANDTPRSWVHGGDATSRPGFDHSKPRGRR